MLNQSPNKRLNPALMLGLAVFVLANISRYVMERKLDVPEHVTDPVNGFLYGLAIGVMLVGFVKQVRLKRARQR